jgi:uncharacterized iron-regulated protein
MHPVLAAITFAIALNGLAVQNAAQQTPSVQVPSGPQVFVTYVPQRVFDTRKQSFTDFESMLADLAHADAVLVGEQHDDPNTHRLEAAVLAGLLRRHVPVTVSLEMFERDVQPALDAYLAGSTTEEEFLKGSRPWPKYTTDYRALVELAKAHSWPVVAANVPRRYAAAVAKDGLAALDALNPTERAMAARDVQCPLDLYFDRFAETMGAHSSATAGESNTRAVTERYYQSQCVKDETMAESIAAIFAGRSGQPRTVVHFTGSFHTDFAAGTAERVRRRLPDRRVTVISILPIDDLDKISATGDDLKRADYLVYTVK